MDQALMILEVLLASIKVATAGNDNAMVKRGVEIGETVLGTVKTGVAVDEDIAERVRVYAAEVEQLEAAGEEDFEAAAADVRDALNRWNAAG